MDSHYPRTRNKFLWTAKIDYIANLKDYDDLYSITSSNLFVTYKLYERSDSRLRNATLRTQVIRLLFDIFSIANGSWLQRKFRSCRLLLRVWSRPRKKLCEISSEMSFTMHLATDSFFSSSPKGSDNYRESMKFFQSSISQLQAQVTSFNVRI